MFSLCFILHTSILLYIIIHLAKLKTMNAESKILWIVFVTFLLPVSAIIFWYVELNKEANNIEVYSDIS